MSLSLSRRDGESWRNAAIRQAEKYGMEFEVGEWYDQEVSMGTLPPDAAFNACAEWGVLDLVND